MTRSKIKQRDGDVMVKVEVETHSAIIPFSDIVEACKVKPDESADAPWEDSDGFEHEVVTDTTDGEAAGSFRDRRGKMLRVIPHHNGEWGGAGRGASKQVQAEARAAAVKRTVEQLAKWHSEGWQVWGIVCRFMGYEDSCWGYYDDDENSEYMRDNIREIASNVAHDMERDGYTVEGKPDRKADYRANRVYHMRLNLNQQNYSAK